MGCDKCGKCCAQNERSTHRSDEEKKELTKRLNIIEGQVRGINQMIALDRYCDDVLIQISAVNKALKSLGNQILESHLKTCVAYEIQMGNLDILDDVVEIIKKLQ
jgi:DNA-binding FrmR family transcriptional regulator